MKKFEVKKIIALMAFAALLTGCGNSASDEQSESSSDASVTTANTEESTETPTTEEATEETTLSTENNDIEYATAPVITEDDVKEQLRQQLYVVVPSGIEVCYHGHVTQHIDIDCTGLIDYAEMNSIDPNELVTVEDFNFDGYVDIFVPETLGAPNLTGKYFRYETEKGFVSWDQLNAVGSFMNIDSNLERLYETVSTSLFEWEMRTYGWENDVLYIAEKEIQYRNDDGSLIREDYEGDKLVKRQKLITGDNEKDVLGFEDMPLY